MDCSLPGTRGGRSQPGGTLTTGFSRRLLGTDIYGRDMLSRIIYGARISIFGGLLIVAAAATIGVPLGLWAGYREGISGAIITRVVELIYHFQRFLWLWAFPL